MKKCHAFKNILELYIRIHNEEKLIQISYIFKCIIFISNSWNFFSIF